MLDSAAARPVGFPGLVIERYRPIDVLVCTPDEYSEYRREPRSFVHSVATTGQTVFERDPQRPED